MKIEVFQFGTNQMAVKLRVIFSLILVPVISITPFLNWPQIKKNNVSNILVFDIANFFLFFFILITGFLLYYMLFSILLFIHHKEVNDRPMVFKIKLSNYFLTLTLFILLIGVCLQLFRISLELIMNFNSFYFTMLFLFNYSIRKADNNSIYSTIIRKNGNTIESLEIIPFFTKTIQRNTIYSPNSEGDFQVGINFLSGIQKCKIKIPRESRFLTKDEFENFQSIINSTDTIRNFGIVLLNDNVIEDDIKLNDPRYKGKVLGTMLGSVEQYEDAKSILDMLRNFVPLNIIRPIKQSNKSW